MFEKSKKSTSRRILTPVVSCVATMACVATLAAVPASAQIFPEYHNEGRIFGEDLPQGETVRTRERPELDALGIHAGSFFIFPSLRQNFTYDDNVFATDGNEKSDVVYRLQPNVAVRSDWNQHSLNITAGADIGFYFDYDSENYEDYYTAVSGLVNVTRNTNIRASGLFSHEHQSRGNPDDVGGADPTELNRYRAGFSGSHRFNRIAVTAGGGFERVDFDDVDAVGGGKIDNDDRDRSIYTPALEVGYQIRPQYVAFIRGSGEFVRYTRGVDRNGFDRDSDGYRVVGGAKIDITNVIFGDVFAGYGYQSYEDPAFSSIDGFVFGGDMKWNPTRLTTVGLILTRQLTETIQDNSSGYVSSSAGVTVDHELLRNLILSAFFGYRNDDYDGTARNDDNFRAGIGANYAMNRHFILNARYAYRTRNSNTADEDYTQNTISGGLTARW